MTEHLDVLIIGGGLAGLWSAVSLARRPGFVARMRALPSAEADCLVAGALLGPGGFGIVTQSAEDDIVAVLALYRPGPMGMNAHNDYADRKNGRQAIKPIHPELADPLADILAETYGLIVYQEQIMRIAQKVASYSLARADILRKAMGKKKREVLEKEFVGFSEGL